MTSPGHRRLYFSRYSGLQCGSGRQPHVPTSRPTCSGQTACRELRPFPKKRTCVLPDALSRHPRHTAGHASRAQISAQQVEVVRYRLQVLSYPIQQRVVLPAEQLVVLHLPTAVVVRAAWQEHAAVVFAVAANPCGGPHCCTSAFRGNAWRESCLASAYPASAFVEVHIAPPSWNV